MSGSEAAGKVDEAASTARDSQALDVITVIGLITFGLVHLVIGWIALQLAFGNKSAGKSADQQGALRQLASTPLGPVLLWIVAAGLFALVLWRLSQVLWGYGWIGKDGRRTRKRIAAAGQAVIYLLLGISAARVAAGGGAGSGDSSKESLSERLLAAPAGVALVVAVGVAIAAVGVTSIVKGLRRTFTEDLRDGGSPPVVALGTVGYVAKGLALAIVGALFTWSAITHDPDTAGGLDTAFKTVKEQPFGKPMLSVMALGFACFGLYCFGWARRAR